MSVRVRLVVVGLLPVAVVAVAQNAASGVAAPENSASWTVRITPVTAAKVGAVSEPTAAL